MSELTHDPSRLWLALALVLAYALLCVLPPWLRARRAAPAAATGADAWLVAYASQTGTAQELAQRTAALLRLGGVEVRVAELDALDAAALAAARRALFIVSTYGEGDPPDNAARFMRRVMAQPAALASLDFAVLALGDRAYGHFCGFGRTLDAWLAEHGAVPLTPRIDCDRNDQAALAAWQHLLSHLAGTSDAPAWSAPALAPWRLEARTLLNPGSAGAPAWHLRFVPGGGALPHWEAGDLVQLAPPGEEDRPRDYSIASIPADGAVELLVRLQRHADGSVGKASGYLAETLAVGGTVSMRVRPHERFRIGANAGRRLILVGNGSGMAGLRAHLKARALGGGAPAWLLFGERNADRDLYYGEELAAWQASGVLARLDLAWSRDADGQYVQHRLLEQGGLLRSWIADGAAVYVCGSLAGMAGGVDEALRELLGAERVEALAAEGRYRRDVY